MTLLRCNVRSRAIALAAAVTVVASAMPALTPAAAHSGGLNAEGCHNNRKTGDYHCHRGPAAGASRQPVRVSAPTGAYRNCTEARSVGAAPVRRGQPGYGTHLDRDGDGVGCE
jgi:uncharacterized membrane protein